MYGRKKFDQVYGCLQGRNAFLRPLIGGPLVPCFAAASFFPLCVCVCVRARPCEAVWMGHKCVCVCAVCAPVFNIIYPILVRGMVMLIMVTFLAPPPLRVCAKAAAAGSRPSWTGIPWSISLARAHTQSEGRPGRTMTTERCAQFSHSRARSSSNEEGGLPPVDGQTDRQTDSEEASSVWQRRRRSRQIGELSFAQGLQRLQGTILVGQTSSAPRGKAQEPFGLSIPPAAAAAALPLSAMVKRGEDKRTTRPGAH